MLFELCPLWMCLELAFYIYRRYRKRAIDERLAAPPFSDEDRELYMERMFDIVRQFGLKESIAGWFCTENLEEVWRGNVEEYLACYWFNSSPQELTNLQQKECGALISQIEQECNHHFKSGKNNDIKCMKQTTDPVNISHRPLAIYGAISFLGFLSEQMLKMLNYQRYETDCFSYWYKPASNEGNDQEAQRTPLLFMHGLGIGISGYELFYRRLPDRAVFLLEFPWISMKLNCGDFPSKIQFTDRIEEMLKTHNVSKVCLIGHSFGTFTATWILHQKPKLVDSMVLIDPACLLLPLPTLCHNALYREAVGFWSRIIFFATREINIAHVLTRKFWWYQNTLWLEDLPGDMDVSVILSERDEIVPVSAIEKYVRNAPASLNMVLLSDLQHGQFLWSNASCDVIVDTIERKH